MSLRDKNFPSFIDTSSSDIIEDFFIPALNNSIRYDRGVGYFSSGWLMMSARGMAQFAKSNGYARWVTSPILSREDWNALTLGDDARTNPVLFAAIERNINDLESSLEKDTLSALAWMVADKIIDFKLALPRNKLDQGDFHDKFGIFIDRDLDKVSFNGSYNDSIQGTRNYESIKIFCSWNEAYSNLVAADEDRFERLWKNEDPNVMVFNLPDAAREKILRLRTNENPYKKSDLINYHISSHQIPSIPSSIKLRKYQEDALQAWFDHDCKGIFEMATGTGKTIAALACAASLFEKKEHLITVISCPYKHLVEQWSDEAYKFNFRPIKVVESQEKWISDLAIQIRSFKKNLCDHVTIITTNSSLLRETLREFLEDVWEDTLFIADEAHHIGSTKLLAILPQKTRWRLGLSATPIRYYDSEGTDAIQGFFGNTVFEFGLEKAIGEFLTRYYYYPIPVEMTESEFQRFCELTKKLSRFKYNEDEPMPEAAQKIAIARARVQNNSLSKIDWIRENFNTYSNIQHTLFYVGDQIFNKMREMLGVEKRIRIHEFTQRQSNKVRRDILEQFANGDLQALIAMKCLDEGVDVPPTRTAYFLASSGNPREFVQRRGRVLRKSKGKNFAEIFDLISIPPMEYVESGKDQPNYSAIVSAIKREYKRVKEFSNLAENKYQALDALFEIASKFGLHEK